METDRSNSGDGSDGAGHSEESRGGGFCVDTFTMLLAGVTIASFSGGYFALLSASFAVIGDITGACTINRPLITMHD